MCSHNSFFFFKQKTAYEMRISDWSSDVCSSDLLYGTDNFTDQGCGMGAEATLYLTERGVQVVGTDAWSWDAPFSHTAKRWAETRDPSIIWEGHKAGRIRPYYQIEQLTHRSEERRVGKGVVSTCRSRVSADH